MPINTRVLTLPILFSTFLAMCQPDPLPVPVSNPTPEQPAVEHLDILALGDSYTKGESVDWTKNFPNQLTDSLRQEGRNVAGLRIIAQTGWRTDNLKSAIAAAAGDIGDSTFSLVTLCIGVNNQYQHASFDTYKVEFEQLLQTAIARAGGRKGRVVVVSIPDYAYTPYGQSASNPAQVSLEIDQYNAANKAISTQYGVQYVDITGISRRGLDEPMLVAGDGLHPSAQQYTEWVKVLLPVIRTMLKG